MLNYIYNKTLTKELKEALTIDVIPVVLDMAATLELKALFKATLCHYLSSSLQGVSEDYSIDFYQWEYLLSTAEDKELFNFGADEIPWDQLLNKAMQNVSRKRD